VELDRCRKGWSQSRKNDRHWFHVINIFSYCCRKLREVQICQFFDFLRWRPPPSWISKFQIFYGRMAQEGWTASLCQIWSKLIELLQRYDNFFIFPRWRPSAILDLLSEWLDHSRRAFGSLYHCAKFGWNRCSSFDNMQVLVFVTLAWKCLFTPIFVGTFPPKNVTNRPNLKKGRPWAEPHHLSHTAWISAARFELGVGTGK